ncbi:MAG: DUF2282 domain-containing protein [Minwuia sp.]|uniref:BufA1 family periplasmic bufferin-type metallophore n=1 Tax=Minwuia sp. TaxID=2493630 RepID=UPI003A85C9A2
MNSTIKTLTVAAALAGAVGMASTLVPSDAAAADKVKCFGIAKAGQNDCANKAGTHSCAGQSTVDYDGGEWKLATAAECKDMGGQEAAFDGVNKKLSG